MDEARRGRGTSFTVEGGKHFKFGDSRAPLLGCCAFWEGLPTSGWEELDVCGVHGVPVTWRDSIVQCSGL